MFHVHFAVVAGEDDVGVVELAGGFQGVEDLAEHGVGFGDHGEVVAADGEDFVVGEVAVGVFGDAHVVHDGMEVGLVGRKGDVRRGRFCPASVWVARNGGWGTLVLG